MKSRLAGMIVSAGAMLGALALADRAASAMPAMDQGVMNTAAAAPAVEKAHWHHRHWHRGHWHHRHWHHGRWHHRRHW